MRHKSGLVVDERPLLWVARRKRQAIPNLTVSAVHADGRTPILEDGMSQDSPTTESYETLLSIVDDAYPDGLVRRCARTDTANGDTLALYLARELHGCGDEEPDSREAAARLAGMLQDAIDDLAGVISALLAHGRGIASTRDTERSTGASPS